MQIHFLKKGVSSIVLWPSRGSYLPIIDDGSGVVLENDVIKSLFFDTRTSHTLYSEIIGVLLRKNLMQK